MPDRSPPNRSELADRSSVGPTDPAPPEPADVPPPPSPPARRLPSFTTLALGAVMVGVTLYGTAGFLRETGLYDVTRGWSKPAIAPGLAAMSGPPAPGAPFSALGSEPARALRDQPPRLPLTDLPQFTVRDGEPHDFLTDLDAETLKRLAEVQGQLDGLGARMTNLNQAVQVLARTAGQQRQQEAAHQSRLQAELAAARQEIAALHAAVEEVEARLKRARGGPGAVAFESDGAVLPGWSVKAISGDRAWLKTPKGQEVTVVAGERLKALGAVRTVDAARGIVVMGDGRVVR